MHVKCLTQHLAQSKLSININYYYLEYYIELVLIIRPRKKNLSWGRYFEIIFNRELLRELTLVHRRREDFVSLQILGEFSCGRKGQTKMSEYQIWEGRYHFDMSKTNKQNQTM